METVIGVVSNCFTFLSDAVTFMVANPVAWCAVGFAIARKSIKTVKGAAKV